ncbi:hypothetical protein BWQ96_00059 [Gracilariopsis chorda]|uniref:Uncharacterized protein n=1 Tax=Gracilariopsis chorda TaxID=448386 RepID=A0A2V3J668_9FLOR|nr:hypothetical protein BWQ96_00059 [Gracilariopsis chorda]|eukprot:PXF49899.1 hypothetical protein BWQ96_00059 [Gracilariopsis chorda]
MERDQKVEVLASVSKAVLRAEKEYLNHNAELQGFRKVLAVLNKLGKTREEKLRRGEDVSYLDALLSESRKRLSSLLSNPPAHGKGYDIDFYKWAAKIQRDVRAQDPLMLSFDSDDGADGMKRSSTRVTDDSTSVSSKGGALLSILKSNGKLPQKFGDPESKGARDKRLFYLTTGAWIFAVFGMMVTIGFLAADFWYAQKNVAIQIESSKPRPLELPVVTLCNFISNVPHFSHFPTDEYPGLPLFGIQRFALYNRSSSSVSTDLIYPDTLPNSVDSDSLFEDVFVSWDISQCKKVDEGFDVEREMNTLRSNYDLGISGDTGSTSCQHCIRLGYKKRIKLTPPQHREEGLAPPAVNVKVYRTKLFAACQTGLHRRVSIIAALFVAEIQQYSTELKDRGILQFDGEEYRNINMNWFQEDNEQFFDFCCNVYFFSGFFYPSSDLADISYEYVPDSTEKWVQTGDGPYFSAFAWKANDHQIPGPSRDALEKDYFTLDSIEIFAEDADGINRTAAISPRTKISAISAAQTALYKFKRVTNQGKNEYEIRRSTSNSQGYQSTTIDVYDLHFDFDTFETKTILTTPTMTWPEFITDVFEFVGLFTGICIFTLIVAPAHSLVYPTSEMDEK